MEEAAPDPAAEGLLAAILVFAPFAFGTTEDWSRAVLCMLSLGLLLRVYAKGALPPLKALPPFFLVQLVNRRRNGSCAFMRQHVTHRAPMHFLRDQINQFQVMVFEEITY